MSQAKIAAFFDLDRTLIDVNSAILYAQFERKHGRISTRQVLTTIFHSLLYHLNIGSMEKAYARAMKHFTGIAEKDLAGWAKDFFEEEVKPRLQPGALPVLQQHKNAGHILVMLTSSSCYQADYACQAWGLDHWIANRFPTENGLFLGTYHKPLVYGDGKVHHAKAWAADAGVDLQRSYFYTDSYSDLPMLKEVGYPMVVNPDPKLRAHALKYKWELLDWRQPKTVMPRMEEANA
ncbi:MAG TPA: HAD family hydrolase [Oligoflexus sp.]|uniref:HAD family hydrolase n=1 Tax=Oligoflexus sp. TaxID=1971216 RepID=UPI002D811675|nr:HAD family hydrolase [Oligoflexus sp.]HET9239392.1 HAD family hydrolase [Oligoflexus sp.]